MLNRQPTQETIADDIAAALGESLAGQYRYLWNMGHWYKNGMGGHYKAPHAAIWQAMIADPDIAPSDVLAQMIDERLRVLLADFETI